ncbi:MAG: PD-(D/E)XK nuclease family protein [bacterium]
MKPKEVSPHKLSMFKHCPKQYYFEYLDPEMAKIKKLIKKKRPALEMGNFIHDTLTLFFKEPPENRNWKKMVSILKEQWKGPRGKSFGFKDIEEERDYYEQSLKMLSWFIKNENINPSIFSLPFSPPGKSFDDYIKIAFSDDLELGGKIDRLDMAPDGTLEVIDYKTGKPEKNFLQLLTYVFLAEKIYGKPVSKAENIYLKSMSHDAIAPTDDLKQQARLEILDIVDKIGLEKGWAPFVSKLCLYCDYLDYCPAKPEVTKLYGEQINEPDKDNTLGI